MTFALTSDAFNEGQLIPARFTCDGDDSSPALSWSDPPDDTQSLALIMDDPDAPVGVFTHWVIYDIPADRRSLPGGVETVDRPSTGGVQGKNDFGRIGYGGPCPPSGTHHYRFQLYALDSLLNLSPGASKQQLLDAITGHILATDTLTGTYRR